MLTVAQVLKSNGTDGEIILGFRDIAPEDIDLQEPVFIEFDGLPVPFFIESFVKRGSSRALVRLTGVKNLRDADELAGKLVAVDYFADEEDGEDFIGWTIFNQDGEQIGEAAGQVFTCSGCGESLKLPAHFLLGPLGVLNMAEPLTGSRTLGGLIINIIVLHIHVLRLLSLFRNSNRVPMWHRASGDPVRFWA